MADHVAARCFFYVSFLFCYEFLLLLWVFDFVVSFYFCCVFLFYCFCFVKSFSLVIFWQRVFTLVVNFLFSCEIIIFWFFSLVLLRVLYVAATFFSGKTTQFYFIVGFLLCCEFLLLFELLFKSAYLVSVSWFELCYAHLLKLK